MNSNNFFVYITTNPKRSTLYIGVTNDLQRRLTEHFQNSGNPKTFTGRYYCYNLVYYERYTSATDAIDREKQLKKWNSEKKEKLIKQMNPFFRFLNEEVMEDE